MGNESHDPLFWGIDYYGRSPSESEGWRRGFNPRCPIHQVNNSRQVLKAVKRIKLIKWNIEGGHLLGGS